MKTFVITSPEGKEFEVTGPDNATEAQAFQMLQQQLGGQQPAPQVAAPVEQPRGYGPVRSVLQGMTFGFADEAGVGAAALAAKVSGDQRPVADIYRDMKDSYNQEQRQYEQAHPWESTALQIGGGVATGIAAAPTAVGRYLAINPIRGGAAVGALTGAGQADTMEDVPRQAAIGGTIGAVTGGITRALLGRPSIHPKGETPGLVGMLGNKLRGVGRPEQAAAQTIAKDLRSSDLTPDEATARLGQMGSESTLSDLSDNLQRTARNVYTQKGPGAEVAKQSLETRSIGGPERVVKDLKRITGKDTNFFETVKGVISNRKAESAPLYAEADQVNISPDQISSLHKQLLDKAKEAEGTRLSGALRKFSGMLKTGDEFKVNVKQLDIVKRQTRDMVSRAYRSGDSDTAKELDGMLKILSNSKGTGILEKASPAYREANKIFSDESAVIKALESGKKVLSSDSDEVMDNLAKLSLAEKDAYVQGAVKGIRDQILSGKKFSNDLVRERLKNAFPDEQGFKEFMSAVEREKTFAATKGSVLGGSQTANKLADAGTAVEAGYNVIMGNYRQAAMAAVRKVLGGQRIPERLHEPLAKALMTPEGSRRALEILRKQGIGNPKPVIDSIRSAVITAVPQAQPGN